MTEQPVLYALADGVATLTLNRPDRLNALNPVLLHELTAAIARAVDDGARALLLRGEGRSFCAGADLAVLPDDLGALLRVHYEPAVRALRDCPIPIVAAVQGAAAGAGCSFALTADIVVAEESAYFLLAFANIGLVPDAGATWAVAKAVGRARAMEMALLGERIVARQALDWGLINRVVADGTAAGEALALARRLATGPSLALGSIRKAVNGALDCDFSTMLAREASTQGRMGKSADFREAVSAFAEKRKPVFRGE